MIAVLLLGLVVGVVLGTLSGERTIRVLRTELNTSRTNEQLLLTRLASRTPAEFHAVTAQAKQAAPTIDTTRARYLHDGTGLISVVDDEDDDR